jgi:hypothetical protein
MNFTTFDYMCVCVCVCVCVRARARVRSCVSRSGERVIYPLWSSVFTQLTRELFLSKAVKLLQTAS